MLRNVTKKRKMLLNNHVIVIFYVKTVYFFIHLKNETIAFFLFFVHFPFFSLRFVLLVICSGRKFIAINAAVCPYCNKEIDHHRKKKNGSHCESNDYTSLVASIISWQPPTSDVKLSLLLSVAVIPIAQ